ESQDSLVTPSGNPPPPSTLPPPLPSAPPPVPASSVDSGSSSMTLVPPPAPPLPGGLPFLAEINSRRADDRAVSSTPFKSSPPMEPRTSPGVPNLPQKPPSAIPPPPPPPPANFEAKSPPPPPSLPMVPPSMTSAPPPLASGLSSHDTSAKSPKPAAIGGLPFLDQINAKRNDAFVVDETSDYSTLSGSGMNKKVGRAPAGAEEAVSGATGAFYTSSTGLASP
ncbi:hypothetical protein OXX59_010199, partial [Metschnikowia pulcherrima]